MSESDSFHYEKIAEVIRYIDKNQRRQPSLKEISTAVHISEFHLQKLFKKWVGVSPKKFLEFLNLQKSKALFDQNKTLLKTANDLGLSGTGRLHDLFIKIESMTPGEYKNEGMGIEIDYFYYETIFGKALVANTKKGICFLGFEDKNENSFKDMQSRFKLAQFKKQQTNLQKKVIQIFLGQSSLDQIKLHLKGTSFQLQVWQALLKIPRGQLSSYQKLSNAIGNPKANRAVGSAVGKNPVSYLIPCHRVIQSTGVFGNYHWGPERKKLMIAREKLLS